MVQAASQNHTGHGYPGLAPIEIEINEAGTGKSVAVTLSTGGTEHPLFSQEYDPPVMQAKVTVASSKLSGIKKVPPNSA